ncbi:NAD(P)-dependent oxidoreductase [Mycolicibacterium sp. F2034L]|uniref:NAD(P)-dependent oxidoreductase n=1 Tax=Mycolicibacterium sp. F2034L TaxID=2926422 RepID=UPI001FF236FD|nr:NAD(P)-dependent oxidoreductase [Mycolicibacterium sp. F2034L]MCK0173921.1 NAD(P)-dependent oxidoreductase [Mycolicibacterium sp. F2034L]
MTQNDGPDIAVIGLGAMGLPMATHLASAFAVTGYEPHLPRQAQAEEAGIRVEPTPAAACANAGIAMLAVRDAAQAEAALFGSDGVIETLPPGAPVILTSTVGPDAARALADQLAESGHPLVDAPISGGPVRAGNGDLLIVVGADDQALSTVRPVLNHLASTLTVVGPRPGDGQALKTINQLLAGVHIAAAAEAVALARGVGLDPGVVIEALSQGAAGSFMFADRGPRMLQAYTGGAEVKSRVDIFVKDMGIVAEVGRASHVPLPLAAAAQQLFLIAEAAGLGAHDDSSVVTILSPDASDRTTPTLEG